MLRGAEFVGDRPAGAASCPELEMAVETWKEIKFEFDVVDKLDSAHA